MRRASASNGSASRMRGSGSNVTCVALPSARATGATSSTATGASCRFGKIAGAGERVLAAWRCGLRALGAYGRDLRLDQALLRARPQTPPAFSISWNSVQARCAELASVRASMPPEPAAGSATLARLDSSSRTSCVLRATRRANAIGQAERQRERQHGDAVGAAEAGGGDRDRRAQHVHVRVALGHHPPRGFGGDEDRLRRQARRLPRRAPTVSAARGIWRWSGTGRRRPTRRK